MEKETIVFEQTAKLVIKQKVSKEKGSVYLQGSVLVARDGKGKDGKPLPPAEQTFFMDEAFLVRIGLKD